MYQCSNCGATMSYPQDSCPSCRAILSGVRCQGCGHTDVKSAFINHGHRCPKCGSVVYISSSTSYSNSPSSASSGCFVATAVFDDNQCLEVKELRAFRDRRLLSNPIGRKLVEFYYRHGPRWAQAVKKRRILKKFIRQFLSVASRFFRHL